MTTPKITLQEGSIVLHEGKVGTEQACCCELERDCYGPCDSSDPPINCEIPEYMYVDWGENNFNGGPNPVPTNALQNQQEFDGFVGTVCVQGDTLCFGENPFDPSDDAPEGTQSSYSIGNVGPVVWCDGVAYVTAYIKYTCAVCTTPPGADFTNPRDLFTRRRSVCLRWENDENGCPVGDAQVVQWSAFTPYAPAPDSGFAPRPEACGDVPSEDCPCSDACDGQLDPIISFLPP